MIDGFVMFRSAAVLESWWRQIDTNHSPGDRLTNGVMIRLRSLPSDSVVVMSALTIAAGDQSS